VSLHRDDTAFLLRWLGAIVVALFAGVAAIMLVELAVGCARPALVQGMSGLQVPIADAPPRRLYDAGRP
jgi:hypothetical protein